jgi:predicted DNA-binding WGR domain protein
VRKNWFDTEEEALTARQTLHAAKQKKGYQSKIDDVRLVKVVKIKGWHSE